MKSMNKIYRSGILLLDKPAGITSAEAINRFKRKHPFSRIGHGGTLDPFATGVLVVLLGEATKVARFLLEGEKEYIALAKLGEETDTGDFTGQVVQKKPIAILKKEDWQSLANSFLGKSTQTPPIYSAIKVNGKALYEYARKEEAVEIKPREIHLNTFEILDLEEDKLRFRVRCSGGTYIRVLANDLAKAGNTCAHLIELRRTSSSQFSIDQGITLADAINKETQELPLLPLQVALEHLPSITCSSDQAAKIRQGNISVFQDMKDKLKSPGYFLVSDEKLFPVAIANHNPMMRPFCNIERVFDPSQLGT